MRVHVEDGKVVVALAPEEAYKIGLTVAGAAPHGAGPDVEAAGLRLMDAACAAGVDSDRVWDSDVVVEDASVSDT